MKNNNVKKIINTALAGIGAAMGIVVTVLGILDPSMDIRTITSLLGISVFALGLYALNNMTKE